MWGLGQLLAAYEVTLKQSAKDESDWNRMRARLYAEPDHVKRARLEAPPGSRTEAPPPQGMTLGAVEALLSQASARDSMYGAA